MTIKEFIEKAIEGGWKKGGCALSYDLTYKDVPEVVLLDPFAWQAVGTVEGWGKDRMLLHYESDDFSKRQITVTVEQWSYRMHRMIDALAEGKTLEKFISTL